MHSKKQAGHTFLAKLGKKRLRPGGVKATNWLIAQANITDQTKILEVACNMGTTAIELAQKYGCQITAIDLSETALQQARVNAAAHNLTNKITFLHGNAKRLDFADASFDVVLNEAMLTMLDLESKKQALSEYYRVLKPGGILLTHDLCINLSGDKYDACIANLRAAINVKATPLHHQDWLELLQSFGFNVTTFSGEMSLLNPLGMIRDEGFCNTLKIVKNALKQENRPMFLRMFKMFRSNKNKLGFIAACSQKPA